MTVRLSPGLQGDTTLTSTQLFATFSNLGGTWPRYFVLKGVDFFSVASCQIGEDLAVQGLWCVYMTHSHRLIMMFKPPSVFRNTEGLHAGRSEASA